MTWAVRLAAVLLFSISTVSLWGQSQAELERRRQGLELQLAETTRLLNNSSRSKTAALSRLTGIQRQIDQREELMRLLRLQVQHADRSVGRTEDVLTSMQSDLDTLTGEYHRMARAALRQNLLRGRWSYLLGAESMGDAFRRVRYLRRYDENRRRQLTLIRATRDALSDKLGRLDTVREAKQQLLAEQLQQQRLLEAELSEKNTLLESLRGDEKQLRRDLARQTEEKSELDGAIASIIGDATRDASDRKNRDEQARRLRSAEAAAVAEAAGAAEAPALAAPRAEEYTADLARDFAKNRGRLPWPVERGFVSKPFGQRAHPTLPKVQVNNNGVDIRPYATTPRYPVLSDQK